MATDPEGFLPRTDIPEPLQAALTRLEAQLLEKADDRSVADLLAHLQSNSAHSHQLARLVALSEFCADIVIRFPNAVLTLMTSGELDRDYDKALFLQQFESLFGQAETIDQGHQPEQSGQPAEAAQLDASQLQAKLSRSLRQFRNIQMLRLIWRDLNRQCNMQQLTTELSHLADVCIELALDANYELCCQRWGTPLSSDGEPMRLMVVGMGKLGAQELNLSSDIDLIFAFEAGGEIIGEGKKLSHQEFFIDLGRRLIKTLDDRTSDGFVFRVDMRLRPYGDSGALVHSIAALEEYYQNQGRDWERYAMIKARVVAGDMEKGKTLMTMLQPFTYRRYIDFSVIDSLRSMKNMIVREVNRKGLQDNIKLGAGGIREIEFTAQVFQLVHGGRDKNLQHRELARILPELKEREFLPADAVDDLLTAYEFLRNVEHALQAYRDEQTQRLPKDDIGRLRLALALDFADWQSFLERLTFFRKGVRTHFDAIIDSRADESEKEASATEQDISVWMDIVAEPNSQQDLGDDEPERADEFLQHLIEFKRQDKLINLQTVARERLDKVMPALISECRVCEHPLLALQGTLRVIDAVLRRSAYLVLLHENPQALTHLVQLCAGSAYVTRKLVQHPLLLDELIDPRSLYQAPDRDEVRSSLRQHMLRIDPADTEAQMEQMRYFKRSQSLRVAAAELSGALPLMKVSDFLSYIAEALLEYVLDLAWGDITAKYGELPGSNATNKRFVVLAYGKLGGLELSHGSDLDLVFVYDADPNVVSTGSSSIDSATYYTRLGQRIIHFLSTRTALGQVYEIDMRLRPSGNSGLLVTSTKGFVDYQASKAWTWEHQALVRARAVAGDAELVSWFEKTRIELLTQNRAEGPLKEQVIEMREKMRDHLVKQLPDGQFHLKHSPGGIVDIEFMVQYAVLAHASKQAAVCEYSDNIRILDALQEFAIVPAERAEQLRLAYVAYRACLHQQSLQDQDSIVDSEQFSSEIGFVREAWAALLEE
ncbi:MAG: bifunctional [glutamate--ammonia ligase]-adenylyl-L-tyrosine phosphorylase/[glutamate--ammonia-ligase] adenylyltransferase [Pseudomonadales bacterium]